MQPAVLCGCGTWSLTWKGYGLSVCDDWELREDTGAEGTGRAERLQHTELGNVYCSSVSIRATKLKKMRWAVHVACMGRRRMHAGF